MRRVRRVVDEFGGGVSAARVVADGEQILERDESQQRGSTERVCQNGFTVGSTEVFGECFNRTAQNVCPIGFCIFRTSLPPKAQRRHVVGAEGGDAKPREIGRRRKANTAFFRTTLNFQRQNLQLAEHAADTGGHHAEVFGARQRTGGFQRIESRKSIGGMRTAAGDDGKFTHCLLLPKFVVAAVEEIVVETIERLLVRFTERLEERGLKAEDARVEGVGRLGVSNEKHVGGEVTEETGEHAVSDASQDVLLSAERGLKGESSAGCLFEEILAKFCSIATDGVAHVLPFFCADRGSGEGERVSVETALFQFVARERKGGAEATERAVNLVGRYFPNAEETEHVVNAIGVKMERHVVHAPFPPSIVVSRHDIPAIGREAPVLTVAREEIGRCAGGTGEAEEVGFCASGHTVRTDADGDVSFENDAELACFVVGVGQLGVQQELHETPEDFFFVDALLLFLCEFLGVWPLAKISRVERVAHGTEFHVGLQPVRLCRDIFLESVASERAGADFGKEVAEEGDFESERALIVQSILKVETVPLFGVALESLAATPGAWVKIVWMKGKDGDGAVGVGVLPGAGARRVVDGENLHGVHAVFRRPADECFKVTEVATAPTALAAQRENGNDAAREPKRWNFKTRLVVGVDQRTGVTHLGQRYEPAVVAALPKRRKLRVFGEEYIFIIYTLREIASGERQRPLKSAGSLHGASLRHVPRSPFRCVSDDSPASSLLRRQSMEQEQTRFGENLHVEFLAASGQHDAVAEGRMMIERGESLFGPAVSKGDRAAVVESEKTPVVRLGTQDGAGGGVGDEIGVANVARIVGHLKACLPDFSIRSLHHNSLRSLSIERANDLDLLAPLSVIG